MEDVTIDIGFKPHDELVLESFGFDEEDQINITEMIEEAIDKMGNIPILNSQRVLQELYDECGDKAFLDGSNMGYPIINPKTGDYDCHLLNKAYYELSIIDGAAASDMKAKAKCIMEKHNWDNRVLVKVNEDVIISLEHLMFILS